MPGTPNENTVSHATYLHWFLGAWHHALAIRHVRLADQDV